MKKVFIYEGKEKDVHSSSRIATTSSFYLESLEEEEDIILHLPSTASEYK